MPLHLRTKDCLDKFKLNNSLKNITLIEPQSYINMIFLEKNASLVVTDSGGLQKEAYLQGTPCVTVREETEWVELIDLGFNKLAKPSDKYSIIDSMNKQIDVKIDIKYPIIYGDGYSADIIISKLKELNFKK